MNQTNFKRFGLMLDMSRNAVMKLDSLKEFLTVVAKMGYNTLMLYTEDTYEISGEPYFGHFRGRYSKEDLKEVVDHCTSLGIEVIPCIQTLAHLNAIFRWPRFQKIQDRDDILLAAEEETYQFIDEMLKTAKECFPSKVIHIGMDEAHALGLGKYLDRNGFENRFQIFTRHIKRVCEMVRGYGLEPVIWSDMFFRLANHGIYSTDTPNIPLEEIGELPEDVAITYWEYYSTLESRYQAMIDAHKGLGRSLWFAGGIWTWKGFAPDNEFSVRATRAALNVCRKENIENVILTLWGDNGAECSRWSVLPGLFAAAQMARGEMDMEKIRADFEKEFGIAFDDFCLLDMHKPQSGHTANDAVFNPEKYLLYNDPFLGICDSTLTGDEGEYYGELSEKLSALSENERFGYLFRTLSYLAKTLSRKANLGEKSRRAYQSGDKKALALLVEDYRTCREDLRDFVDAFRSQWLGENMPQGLEIQELRLGGLKERLASCQARLQAYLSQGTEIPELLEKPLDLQGGGEELSHKPMRLLHWGSVVSPNVLNSK